MKEWYVKYQKHEDDWMISNEEGDFLAFPEQKNAWERAQTFAKIARGKAILYKKNGKVKEEKDYG